MANKNQQKEISRFQTYWIVNGVRCETFATMEQRVLAGAIAIEVSAESQQQAAEKRAEQAIANAIKDEKIRKAAVERQHANSAEGKRQAAIRTALANPGGIISGGLNPFAELEAFGPARTNLIR